MSYYGIEREIQQHGVSKASIYGEINKNRDVGESGLARKVEERTRTISLD